MIHKVIKINNTDVSNSLNTLRAIMLMLITASVCVLGAGVGTAEDVDVTLDHTLNKISGETENKEVLNLENGYTIRITDIDKDASHYKIRLILEKDSVELDEKLLETGQEYSWYDGEDHIKLNAEIFIGTSMDVVFFKNIYQISNENTIINNETFTLIYSRRSSGSLNTADNNNIEGFTTLNENVLQSSSFPLASGYSQEFLKENYSLALMEVDVDGDKAWISLYKNGVKVDSKVVAVSESYNYNSSLSFKLDKVFAGTSSNYIEISNIYQYSEEDSSVIVQNESALLLIGSTGKFILTGGGLEWQLEENYTLHAIDIDIAGHSREAMLLITKDGTHIDYTIINVSDSFTYYKNGNLTITVDLETVFSGEGGVSLARLYHIYQYSEDTGEILLNDTIHLYSVGDTREVEWQLDQNYSLSAMDIDSKNTPRQVWLRLKKDGNTLEDKFVYSGDSAIFYDSGMKILNLNVGTIFDGKEADLVFISDIYQYSETDENDILIENEPHLFIFGSSTGNDWQLYENYTLSFMDIDIKKSPNQVWLRMKKNGTPVDDNVVVQNEDYKYYNNSTLLFEGYLKSSFGGRYLDMLTFTNASQYSEVNSIQLIADVTYYFYPENVEQFMDLNDKLSLEENYTIVPVDIQISHESLWLRLYKDDAMVDEVILLDGQNYSYHSDSREIISTNLATIFLGMNTDLIKFEDFYQYSEVNGSMLKYYDDLLLKLGRLIPPSAPVALDQSVATPENTIVDITLSATDVNGDLLTYSIVDDPSHGNVTLSGNIATYTPDMNYNGSDNFTFKANDSTVDSNTATVSITIGAVNNFPPAQGYSQELLKENYSLTLLEVNPDRNEAWISLSKNGVEVDDEVVAVGESYYYNSSLSFKLDKVFKGTSGNYIEISNIYQYSEEDSSVLVQDESALLTTGYTGKFILTGGGLEWQLEENYTLHAIDIDTAGHSHKALLLITKDGTHVDYTIINVSDRFTYYKNGNLTITVDLETVFSGEGGVSLARLYHLYQYSEDTGDILLNDTIHLYSVGNTREVEWQLNQNYSLSLTFRRSNEYSYYFS